ncbi:MAG: flagellar hook-length control protein FliK [Solirubrobacteraceae bacterium]
MQDMIDAIRATVELAVRQGSTQARIALQPAELGEIHIHLSQTAEGLLVRVTADTPAAAQALAQGRSELHQSLSSLGVAHVRLDLDTLGQSQTGERQDRSAGDPHGSASTTIQPISEDDGSAETVGELEAPSASLDLLGARLVDVLA